MKPKQYVSPNEAAGIGMDAYIYGYPLVLMDATRQVMTAVPRNDGRKAPINQLLHFREFPDYTFTDVVSPNADTLYSTAWLDLTKEPIVLSVPSIGRRYYLIQMLDAWTNVFAVPGTRTTGNGEREFAIVGPQWNGKLPLGVREIKSPTNMVWVVGRIQTNGKADYAAVHSIQDRYMLTPLGALGSTHTPPDKVPVAPGIDQQTPPAKQVAKMHAASFFARLNSLMKNNPPAAADATALARFAAIGVAPGTTFNLEEMDPAVAKSIEESVRVAQAKIIDDAKKPLGKIVNGWQVFDRPVGNYGTDYLWRAIVALVGLGANLPEDAIYPHATTDAQGQPLTGANRYVVHFPKGQLPPVNAFWSLTMYNSEQAFVQNPINRYAIGDRDNLRFNDDGSLTLYIQNESPGKDKESNWLPAPSDSFNIVMRLYWPKKEIVDGTWKIPPLERVQ
jgi:hypothetical protein